MIDFGCFSDSGPRTANEDAVLAIKFDSGKYLLAVADGLGGHLGGAEASKLAIEHLQTSPLGDGTELESVFHDIHRIILQHQSASNLAGMATTLTAVVIEGHRLYGAHCGDTRCVLQRGEGIKKLTIEHTEAQRLFDAGKLTKDQLLDYPRRNILDSALGVQDGLRVDTFTHDLIVGDKVLITSDGVHELIKLREILYLVGRYSDSKAALDAIKERVEAQGAEDNFSAACAVVT